MGPGGPSARPLFHHRAMSFVQIVAMSARRVSLLGTTRTLRPWRSFGALVGTASGSNRKSRTLLPLGVARASTQPEAPIHNLRRLILSGKLEEILGALDGGVAATALGKPEIRDILCRLGELNEVAVAGNDANRDVAKRLLALLVDVAKEQGLSLPDATLISRASARAGWDYRTISQFLGMLREEGVKADAAIYENFMGSLLRVQDSYGGERLLMEMEVDRVRGNTTIYGLLSEIFVAQGRKDALDRLLKSQQS